MSNNLEIDKAIETAIEEFHNLLKEILGEVGYNRLYREFHNLLKESLGEVGYNRLYEFISDVNGFKKLVGEEL